MLPWPVRMKFLYGRPEMYVSICSDSQVAPKAFQATRMSPLVQQCQKGSTDISTQHTVGLYWVPGQAGVRGNEIASKLTRDGSVQSLLVLSRLCGVSRQNIRRKITHWMDNAGQKKSNFFLSHKLQYVNLAVLFVLNSDMYTELFYQTGFQ